jgi:hypothetical protein
VLARAVLDPVRWAVSDQVADLVDLVDCGVDDTVA